MGVEGHGERSGGGEDGANGWKEHWAKGRPSFGPCLAPDSTVPGLFSASIRAIVVWKKDTRPCRA